MRATPKEDFIVINRIALTILVALLAGGALAVDLTDAQKAAITERIKPMGESCMEGDNTCGAPAVAASAGPRSGEEVYNTTCMACHSTGAAGAPKLGDAAGWAARIAKGTDALYASGVNGVAGTGMIAKGGCVACTDEEIHAAVDFMVSKSQ